MNSLYWKPEFEDITLELKKKLQNLRAKYKDDNQEDFSSKNPGQEVSHKALGCEVLHENPYAAKYSAGRANALTDGKKSIYDLSLSKSQKIWQGFEGDDMIAIINLKEPTSIQSISTGFLQNIDINYQIFKHLK